MTWEEFRSRVVLVTGAGSGIGAQVAHDLATAGATVIATDRLVARVVTQREAWASTGLAIQAAALDVTDRAAFEELASSVREQHGRLDGLVANAGAIRPPRPLEEWSDADWERLVGVNAKGVFNGLAACLPLMYAQGSGAVVNVGSVTAVKSVPGLAVYGASKAAVTALTRAAAVEAGPHGVRVNELQPGPTLTPMVLGRDGGHNGAEERFAAASPLGRLATPAEQSQAVLFLLSDAASYVNGASLLADGGLAWS